MSSTSRPPTVGNHTRNSKTKGAMQLEKEMRKKYIGSDVCGLSPSYSRQFHLGTPQWNGAMPVTHNRYRRDPKKGFYERDVLLYEPRALGIRKNEI